MTFIANTRPDGRTNTEVIVDFVKDAEPGTVFPFSELKAAIEEGSDKECTVQQVRGCVLKANLRLLKQEQRELKSVRGVGYRLCHAHEHTGMAIERRTKADRQLARGIKTLQNVRYDEMDTNQRAAHEGTLMIMSALYHQVSALQARQAKHEEAIQALIDGIGSNNNPEGALNPFLDKTQGR